MAETEAEGGDKARGAAAVRTHSDSADAVPLGMLANRLTRAFEAEFFRRLAEAGHSDLRMRHAMLLELLPETGARSGVLAALLGISKQAVGEIVDDLEGADYIHRIPDPADRRAKLIVLSAKGESAFREAFTILRAMDGELAAIAGSERYSAARTTLARLTEFLEVAPEPRPQDLCAPPGT